MGSMSFRSPGPSGLPADPRRCRTPQPRCTSCPDRFQSHDASWPTLDSLSAPGGSGKTCRTSGPVRQSGQMAQSRGYSPAQAATKRHYDDAVKGWARMGVGGAFRGSQINTVSAETPPVKEYQPRTGRSQHRARFPQWALLDGAADATRPRSSRGSAQMEKAEQHLCRSARTSDLLLVRHTRHPPCFHRNPVLTGVSYPWNVKEQTFIPRVWDSERTQKRTQSHWARGPPDPEGESRDVNHIRQRFRMDGRILGDGEEH